MSDKLTSMMTPTKMNGYQGDGKISNGYNSSYMSPRAAANLSVDAKAFQPIKGLFQTVNINIGFKFYKIYVLRYLVSSNKEIIKLKLYVIYDITIRLHASNNIQNILQK